MFSTFRNTAVSLGAAALALAFAAHANATIVGSTYDFSTSATGQTGISPAVTTPTPKTDPSNPAFQVGDAATFDFTLSGSFAFAKVSPTHDTITFSFFGSTSGGGPGTFSIDLGNFVTTDGEKVTAVSYASGNFLEGDFSKVTFNGTDAVFEGSTNGIYNAQGNHNIVFDVTTTSPAGVPEPSSVALLASAVLGFMVMRRRRNRR
jgi:hypothetical protein